MTARLVFPDDVRPDFEGFSDAGFGFLRDLARNNERGWFNENREAYESEIRFPLECLVAEFRAGGAGRGLAVRGDPTKAIFRIYRDIRFSRNKQPYKTHAGAVLSRSGSRGEAGVVYIHIQPGNCFVSAGFWRVDPPTLTAWRRRMIDDPEEWLALVAPYEDGKDAAYMRTISALKTMPRGFKQDADSPVAAWVKWKSFLLTRPVEDADARTRSLVEIVREHAGKATPLLEYGWEIDDMPADDDPRRHMRMSRARDADWA